MGSSSSSSCVNGVDFMERGGRRVSFGNTGSRRDKKEVITEFVYTESRKGRKKCLESVKEVCLCGDWNRWAPIAMQCEQVGVYSVITPVPLGYHEFCYLINGTLIVSRRHPITSSGDSNWRIIRGPPLRSRHRRPRSILHRDGKLQSFLRKITKFVDSVFQVDRIPRLRSHDSTNSDDNHNDTSENVDHYNEENVVDIEQGRHNIIKSKNLRKKKGIGVMTAVFGMSPLRLIVSAISLYALATYVISLRSWSFLEPVHHHA